MSEAAASGSPDTPRPSSAEADAAPRPAATERSSTEQSADGGARDTGGSGGTGSSNRRRRGSRGGRNRSRSTRPDGDTTAAQDRAAGGDTSDAPGSDSSAPARKPQIGDTRPAPPAGDGGEADTAAGGGNRNRGGNANGGGGDRTGSAPKKRRRRGGRGRGSGNSGGGGNSRDGGGGRGGGREQRPVEAVISDDDPVELDAATLEQRRGRERNGRPVGRYLMAVSKRPGSTQISVLEGRNLIEHYVSRPSDNETQIHGNIYLGKVQNVLPGMEAAFIDIGTPKNAVLYRGDVQFDPDDVETKGEQPRIEQMLKARQTIICQVTKNPIAHKGARLTQEVSLPGRFVVLIPNSKTYGISKRLPDNERKRLRNILDRVRPEGHGIIVRTAAENVTAEEIERDVARLSSQWQQIEALANSSQAPALLYREPDMAVRVIREEFNKDYRSVVIDDRQLFEEVRDYVAAISPALADRVEFYDPDHEKLPLFERHHVHEQLHKALDRKVWLPSGGSLIIEHTEALTVIDVNTGKNVGSSNLEETVYRNNLEAAEEIARQLRLRDIGGIIVIDFVDMEIKSNRDDVARSFRDALARDKTRTQVFDISELGLIEMTRKRIGEGLLESLATRCPECDGRAVVIDTDLVDS
ncbi:MAG: Rne/Rng family ribonuclease [Acidimicrobiales bacterium]